MITTRPLHASSVVVAVLLGGGALAGCVERVPSQLVVQNEVLLEQLRAVGPGFTRTADLAITNVGDAEVNIEGGAFAPLPDHDGEEQAFSEVLFDYPTEREGVVTPHEQVNVRFRYTSLQDGAGPDAVLVISSDAAENPELKIELHVDDFVTPAADAGFANDAGFATDGGFATDAGFAVDSGGDPDAGADTDSGA